MNPLYPLSSFMEKHVQQREETEDPNLKLYIFSSSTTTSQAASAAAAASSASQLANFATCFDQTGKKNLDHHLYHRLQDQSPHQLPHDHDQVGEKSNGGLSRLDEEVENQIGKTAKYWMSSKMRVMQKMMADPDKKSGAIANSDHKPGYSSSTTRNYNNDTENKINSHRHGGKWEILGRSSNCSNGHNGVRVCSDCNTTTTPLWRSGPQGPKSLCNACGIRQRKARRAMAEAASGGGGGSEAASGKQLHKEKKCRTSCHGDTGIVKNKMTGSDDQNSSGTTTKVSFDHHSFTLRLRKSSGSSAFGRVFARDEEEAAILLMELSCGLLHTC